MNLYMILLHMSIAAFLMGTCFFCGCFIKHGLKVNFQCSTCAVGVIAILGGFQIIAIPFMYFHLKFIYLYIACIIFIGGMMLAGVAFCIGEKKAYHVKGLEHLWKRKMFVLAIVVVMIQCIIYIVSIQKGSDDSFYIAIINTTIEDGFVMRTEPSTGNASFLYLPQYELVGYEVLSAVICQLFHLNAAIYCHVVIPVFFLIIHYLIVYDISKMIAVYSKGPNNADKLFFIFSILNLFSSYTEGVSRGVRLLSCLWLGKAVLINIVLPFLIVLFLDILKKGKIKKNILILLVFTFYAAFAVSATGIYLFPLAYAIYVLTFFCMVRDLKESIKLCVPVIMALPYVILKYSMIAGTDMLFRITEGAEDLNYMDALRQFNGRRYMIVVYGVALLVLLVFGERNQKYLFAVYPMLGILTYANPFLHTYVAKYITGTDVYERVFWLLQITFTFEAAIACIMFRLRDRQWAIPGIVLLGMFLSGCRLRYYHCGFEFKENPEGITNTTKQLADVIIKQDEDDNRLMLPKPYVYEVRQYTGKIELVWSKYVPYVLPENVDENYVERLDDLYNTLYKGGEINNDLWNAFDYFDVRYVGMFADDTREFEECPIVYEDSELIIYDIKKNNY